MFRPGPRTLCFGIAALLLGAAAVTGFPANGRAVTASATVNAPVIRIASPFDGRVVQAPPARGATVQPGDTLVRVEAHAPARGEIATLKAKLAMTARRQSAVAQQTKSLNATRAELKSRMERYRKGAIARLGAQLREAEALHKIFKARLAQSEEALERQERLKTKGYASQANYDAATASAIVARSDLAASAARIERIRVELSAAKNGVFITDGRDDVPYSQQRDDEIALRLIDLTAEARTLDATVSDLREQIAAEYARVASTQVFDQTARVAGVVQHAATPEGAPVRAGEPLVNLIDCGRAYLEVAVDARDGAGIKAGDRARVRLQGVEAVVDATVRTLRNGTGPKAAKADRMTVRVDLPTAPDAATMQAFCHVGRTAEVTFSGSPKTAVKAPGARKADMKKVKAKAGTRDKKAPGPVAARFTR